MNCGFVDKQIRHIVFLTFLGQTGLRRRKRQFSLLLFESEMVGVIAEICVTRRCGRLIALCFDQQAEFATGVLFGQLEGELAVPCREAAVALPLQGVVAGAGTFPRNYFEGGDRSARVCVDYRASDACAFGDDELGFLGEERLRCKHSVRVGELLEVA